MDPVFRSLIKGFLIAGGLFILFGFGQFFLSFGLDRLGVIEVGNGLGLGLLLYLSVALGLLVLLLALLLRLLAGRDTIRSR
jgi:hypothetical protein